VAGEVTMDEDVHKEIATLKKEIGDLRIMIAKHDALFVLQGAKIIQALLKIADQKDVPE
jgi:hypothetical protein